MAVGFSSFGDSKTFEDGYAGGSPKKSMDCSGTENLSPERENEILYQHSCHSLITVGHWYQLTNKGEEAVELLQVVVELSQTVVIKQLEKPVL